MELYRKRVKTAQQEMVRMDQDLMVLFPSSNMRYLSGFYDEPGERMLFLLIPSHGKAMFLVPELYEQQVRQASPFIHVGAWKDSEDPRTLLEQSLTTSMLLEKSPTTGARRPVRVLVDDGMWASFYLMLQSVLPDAHFSLATRLMRVLRMTKSVEEIGFLREAGSIADRAFETLIGMSIEGMSEMSLAARIEEAMRENGAGGIAFETLVASGPNSALPHHRAGGRKIRRGDVVVLDYGCRVGGYCSDITRTVVCGKPSGEVQDVYRIVKEAQETAVQGILPGMEAQEVDRLARGVIEKSGYGAHFIHRTGHGIGIDVHEEPYMVEGNRLKVQEGMSFSVEPGIYLQGKFGIRIEDIVVLSGKKAHRINDSTRELQLLK
jgi:Xaa-Pro aminopeptidase